MKKLSSLKETSWILKELLRCRVILHADLHPVAMVPSLELRLCTVSHLLSFKSWISDHERSRVLHLTVLDRKFIDDDGFALIGHSQPLPINVTVLSVADNLS